MGEIAFTKVALPYGWLGNMAPFPIQYQELRWPTVEHLFQALRFEAVGPAREEIRIWPSPMGAKMISKRNKERWIVEPRSKEDVANMLALLQLKLSQHPELRHKLVETGTSVIIEDCSARPNESGLFWGMARTRDGWRGQNILGKMWMGLRAISPSLSGREA